MFFFTNCLRIGAYALFLRELSQTGKLKGVKHASKHASTLYKKLTPNEKQQLAVRASKATAASKTSRSSSKGVPLSTTKSVLNKPSRTIQPKNNASAKKWIVVTTPWKHIKKIRSAGSKPSLKGGAAVQGVKAGVSSPKRLKRRLVIRRLKKAVRGSKTLSASPSSRAITVIPAKRKILLHRSVRRSLIPFSAQRGGVIVRPSVTKSVTSLPLINKAIRSVPSVQKAVAPPVRAGNALAIAKVSNALTRHSPAKRSVELVAAKKRALTQASATNRSISERPASVKSLVPAGTVSKSMTSPNGLFNRKELAIRPQGQKALMPRRSVPKTIMVTTRARSIIPIQQPRKAIMTGPSMKKGVAIRTSPKNTVAAPPIYRKAVVISRPIKRAIAPRKIKGKRVVIPNRIKNSVVLSSSVKRSVVASTPSSKVLTKVRHVPSSVMKKPSLPSTVGPLVKVSGKQAKGPSRK